MGIVVIALLTVRELVRRRLLVAMAVLTVIAVLLSGWGFLQLRDFRDPDGVRLSPVELRLVTSQLLIVVTFMYSFVLALGAVFVAAPAVAGDLESGIGQSMLARPLRRAEFVLGRWLGTVLLVALYAIVSGVAELAVVGLITGYVPPRPVEAIAFLIAQATVMVTITLLLSTRLPPMTSGVVATVLFGLTWMAGVIGGLGAAFGEERIEAVGALSRLLLPTDGLWRGTIYSLEPVEVLASAVAAGPRVSAFPFLVTEPLANAYLYWSAGWVVVVLALAVVSLERRDL